MRLIDAEALDARIYNEIPIKIFGTVARMANMREIISQAPTIEAEPVRHGYWIGTEFDGYADGAPVYDEYECSVCGDTVGASYFNGIKFTMFRFCPNCGARMDGGDKFDQEIL